MKHFFESYVLIQQDIITSKEAAIKFLSLPGICDIRSELENDFLSDCGPLMKWHRVSEALGKYSTNQVSLFIMVDHSNWLFLEKRSFKSSYYALYAAKN